MKQILWQLINSADVSEVKHYTQLIKTDIIPCAWKAQVLRFGIPKKSVDEIYNVHSELSSKKREKKTVHVATKDYIQAY